MADSDFPSTVLQFVKAHYDGSTAPLHLSEVGNKLETPEEGPRLSQMIRDQLADELVLLKRDPSARAADIVALKGSEDQVSEALAQRRQEASLLRSLPRSLLVAFCKEIPDGARIFYRLTPRFRFEVSNAPPDGSYVEIEPQYRRPGIYVNLERMPEEKRRELFMTVRAWLDSNEIDPSIFGVKEAHRRGQARPLGGTALERLLEAQDPETRSRMMIPGDIAQILLRN